MKGGLLAGCLIACATGEARASAFDVLSPVDTALRRLAAPAGYDPPDLNLLVNYRSIPPIAPSVVTNLLRNPRTARTVVPALRATISDLGPSGFVRSEGLWRWIDAGTPRLARYRGLPRRARDATAMLRDWASGLEPAEIAFLLRETPGLFRPGAEDTLMGPLDREAERLRADALADSVQALAARLSMTGLAEASTSLDALLQAFIKAVRERGPEAAIALARELRREAGVPVLIGTSGADTLRPVAGLVLDPGGDDTYLFPDSARPGSWLMVVDLDGDDTYRARDTSGGAAAFLSVQILADLAGDDRYLGGDLSFGAALLGFARLYDAAGDDQYEGRSGSLGFAFRGIGILQDGGGNDRYSAAYLSQGASSTFGFGLLLDLSGDDAYVTRPVFLDDLRYRDRYLSLSQGFSTGMAPSHAGGIAALWDRAGNDTYTADIFGQGAGYWFALGMLLDDAGDDIFRAHQYAQGAGVHFAAGALLDGSGNDVRASKGVSQGCGHDGGFGLLADAAGDDVTAAVDMSAGAGSANGLGIFVDLSGNDAYRMGNPAMTLGHGDMRRDRGSTGFFLDLGGNDVLPPELQGRTIWRVYDGKRGNGHGTATEE